MDLSTKIRDCGMNLIGHLKTAKSVDIESSRFSVGCETLDRGMWKFDRALPHLAALGAKHARVQTGWGRCERTKGVYDFAWLDAIVDPLVAAGIEPWFNVGYGNRVYLPDAPHETAVGWTPINDPGAREGWANFTAALARHFQGRVTYYEVWNEPDIKPFWTPYDSSPESYTDLVALTSRAIRAADPEAKIVGGAQAGALSENGLAWAACCMERGMAEHIDAYSYHIYVATPEKRYTHLQPALRDLLRKARPGMPVWQGESGAPSKAQAGQALAEYEWDEAKQAKWDLRRSLLDLAADADLISFFHIADFEFYIVKDQVIHKPYFFGLLRGPDYVPKPAYYAAQTLCTLLSGDVRRDDDLRPTVQPTDLTMAYEPSETRAFAFRTPRGPIVAVWQGHDMMQPFAPRTVLLDAAGNGKSLWKQPVLVDPVAQSVYAVPASAADGRLSIPLADCPVLIAERDAIPL